MDPTLVVWVVPHADFDLGNVRARLFARGFDLVRCLPGLSSKIDAPLRVLQTDLFPDVRHLRTEYEADAKPTLIVASTAEQEITVIDFLQGSGDVVIGPHPVEMLAYRLARLLRDSASLARLEGLAHEDQLTGIANRRRFQMWLEEAVAADEADECRAVVFFDLDNFKSINDQFGHLIGDQVLREIAVLLQQGAAPGDRFARLGGDKFVCLLTRYDLKTVVGEPARALRRLEEHEFQEDAPASGRPHDGRLRVTASAGMTFVRSGRTADDLLREADKAMYESKSKGGNRVVIYEQMQASAAASNKDSDVEHFRNVTRVLNERIAKLVARLGENLIEEVRRQANHDALTHLHNRRYFDSRIVREIERAKTHGLPLTIALMDLDDFGNINTKYDYPTGDRALSRFADVALSCVRSMDWLARYGGEEFCLVMPDTDIDTGMRVAERIRAAVEAMEVQSLEGQPVAVTLSIGAVQWSPQLDGAVGLIKNAGGAVRQAKEAGKNCVRRA